MKATDLFHNFFLMRRILARISLVLLSSATPLSAAITFNSFNDSSINTSVAIQGGLLLGTTLPTNKVWLDNKPITIAKDGSFILGFGRDAKDTMLKIESDKGVSQQQIISVKKRKYNIERVDGLPPSKVNPIGDEVLKRIRKESAQVQVARKRNDQRHDYIKGFIWPAKGRISGVYGSQRVLNGEAKRPHFGIDIAAVKGSKVIAPASGIITLAETDLYYSGGTIIIDHGFGLSSTFLHLSKLHVKVGQRVEQADLIAEIGATGRATGAHLDWRMNWHGVRLDPELLVKHLSMTDNEL